MILFYNPAHSSISPKSPITVAFGILLSVILSNFFKDYFTHILYFFIDINYIIKCGVLSVFCSSLMRFRLGILDFVFDCNQHFGIIVL